MLTVDRQGGHFGAPRGEISEDPPVRRTQVLYSGRTVGIKALNVNLALTPSGGTLCVNQQNVANAITGFFNARDSLPAVFGTLNAAGLTTASGKLGTGALQSSIKADDLFLNLLLDPSVAGRANDFAAPGGGATAFAGDGETTPMPPGAGRWRARAMPLQWRPRRRGYIPRAASSWSVWGAAYAGSETVGGNAVVGSQDSGRACMA